MNISLNASCTRLNICYISQIVHEKRYVNWMKKKSIKIKKKTHQMFSCVPNNYRLEITMICIVLELVAMEHNNDAF